MKNAIVKNRISKFVVGWVFCVGLLATGPVAADDKRLLQAFDVNDVIEALGDLDMTGTVQKTSKGEDYVLGQASDGLYFYMMPLACEGDNCYGLEVFASFYVDEPGYWKINEIDHRYSFINVMRDRKTPNIVMLQRYLIADHGLAFGNLKTNLDIFVNIMRQFPSMWTGYGIS